MSNDIIREFNIKCTLVTPDDKSHKPYVILQVPKGVTVAHQLDCLPQEILTLLNSYLTNDILMIQNLKDSLKKLPNKSQSTDYKCKPKDDHITVQYDNFPIYQKD